ncbi:MAG: hypothetical protein QXX56_05565, partial [Candidatus Bathyarchaeia archaeon]
PKEKTISDNIRPLLEKYTQNYRVKVNDENLTIYVPRENYPIVLRKCVKKIERICRKAGFTNISIEIT